jgi:hypothetical protein
MSTLKAYIMAVLEIKCLEFRYHRAGGTRQRVMAGRTDPDISLGEILHSTE